MKHVQGFSLVLFTVALCFAASKATQHAAHRTEIPATTQITNEQLHAEIIVVDNKLDTLTGKVNKFGDAVERLDKQISATAYAK